MFNNGRLGAERDQATARQEELLEANSVRGRLRLDRLTAADAQLSKVRLYLRLAHGWHWIGATKPTVTIYEFSDYQCPHCLRGHEQMRKLLAQYPDKLRLVHRHYPLDHQCNPAINRNIRKKYSLIQCRPYV